MIGTLEELWISYNQINSLDGLNSLTNLTTLYISNNLIKSWAELDKIVILFIDEVYICDEDFLTYAYCRLVYRTSVMCYLSVTQCTMILRATRTNVALKF